MFAAADEAPLERVEEPFAVEFDAAEGAGRGTSADQSGYWLCGRPYRRRRLTPPSVDRQSRDPSVRCRLDTHRETWPGRRQRRTRECRDGRASTPCSGARAGKSAGGAGRAWCCRGSGSIPRPRTRGTPGCASARVRKAARGDGGIDAPRSTRCQRARQSWGNCRQSGACRCQPTRGSRARRCERERESRRGWRWVNDDGRDTSEAPRTLRTAHGTARHRTSQGLTA